MKKIKISELTKRINGIFIGEDFEVEGINAIPLAKERI
jgi:UDP-3-O-[3-hydroxymyristoyl] glucosamine N-acyltransferase